MKIPIKFYLDTETDRDLIEVFNDLSAVKRNRLIKEALRSHSENTLEYIKRKLDFIASAINSGIVVKEKEVNIPNEDKNLIKISEDVFENLDKLGVV